jgi:DNA-binding transcriptional ArsR family regulator
MIASAIVNPMVKYHQRLDATFAALADPTRRAILATLTRGQKPVSVLAAPHRMSLPAVMKHLQVLEQAGLVRQRKKGRVRHCRLAARPLKQAEAWLSKYRIFWETHFDALDRYLKQQQSAEGRAWARRNRQPARHSRSRERFARRGK